MIIIPISSSIVTNGQFYSAVDGECFPIENEEKTEIRWTASEAFMQTCRTRSNSNVLILEFNVKGVVYLFANNQNTGYAYSSALQNSSITVIEPLDA